MHLALDFEAAQRAFISNVPFATSACGIACRRKEITFSLAQVDCVMCMLAFQERIGLVDPRLPDAQPESAPVAPPSSDGADSDVVGAIVEGLLSTHPVDPAHATWREVLSTGSGSVLREGVDLVALLTPEDRAFLSEVASLLSMVPEQNKVMLDDVVAHVLSLLHRSMVRSLELDAADRFQRVVGLSTTAPVPEVSVVQDSVPDARSAVSMSDVPVEPVVLLDDAAPKSEVDGTEE